MTTEQLAACSPSQTGTAVVALLYMLGAGVTLWALASAFHLSCRKFREADTAARKTAEINRVHDTTFFEANARFNGDDYQAVQSGTLEPDVRSRRYDDAKAQAAATRTESLRVAGLSDLSYADSAVSHLSVEARLRNDILESNKVNAWLLGVGIALTTGASVWALFL